jgi:hypothetical protein
MLIDVFRHFQAAKRGLDTVTAVAKEKAPETDINRFVVAGASKVLHE